MFLDPGVLLNNRIFAATARDVKCCRDTLPTRTYASLHSTYNNLRGAVQDRGFLFLRVPRSRVSGRLSHRTQDRRRFLPAGGSILKSLITPISFARIADFSRSSWPMPRASSRSRPLTTSYTLRRHPRCRRERRPTPARRPSSRLESQGTGASPITRGGRQEGVPPSLRQRQGDRPADGGWFERRAGNAGSPRCARRGPHRSAKQWSHSAAPDTRAIRKPRRAWFRSRLSRWPACRRVALGRRIALAPAGPPPVASPSAAPRAGTRQETTRVDRTAQDRPP